MNKRMLIDTSHAEETRVVVMNGDRIEDYDVETSSRKLLKGNIYLAKVIRVEPSLQAAFVEYGGNRHGFLAFSEIHPDYFQIPVADREKLLSLQEEECVAEPNDAVDAPQPEDDDTESADRRTPETVGGEHDTGEESAAARRTARFLRNYKIQEVIRRRQILLVQVVKEERGNKGAALTTYISLAGRYCVLMPNALRGGGVSRKITSESDRRRLRDIITELELPQTMAMIVRTAGAGRPGAEIIRDCEYLLQLWDDIRSHALSSVAPTLVYEEASLIKRAIRDLFSKDIDDILVDGESAWKNAREFMRLLMPHNVNRVKLWQPQGQSLFAHYNVEGHLDAMFSPTARLKSGGYLVINQTEALVSIDVNSGKSTSQRNIEETAVRTNLEAADEVARQLRLRDLAGLIVIDFIDMESRRHNSQVERRLKDALRSDRARIQVGHISHFGLLEMSRQRLRPSISEAVLSPCPHCEGTGFVRGTDSSALHILRTIDEEGARQQASEIDVYVRSNIALYILNNKRSWLTDIETRHRMRVVFRTSEELTGTEIRIERIKAQSALPATSAETTPRAIKSVEIIEDAAPVRSGRPARLDTAATPHDAEGSESHHGRYDAEDNGHKDAPPSETDDTARHDGSGNRNRRRRRRQRGRRDHDTTDMAAHDSASPVQTSPHTSSSTDHGDAPAARPSGPGSVADSDEAEDRDDVRLIPGRRRTRFKRVDKNEDTVKTSFPDDQEKPAGRPYHGPTPANPFGGSFDIFDVIEQAELSQTSRPVSEAVSEPLSIRREALEAVSFAPELHTKSHAVPQAAARPNSHTKTYPVATREHATENGLDNDATDSAGNSTLSERQSEPQSEPSPEAQPGKQKIPTRVRRGHRRTPSTSRESSSDSPAGNLTAGSTPAVASSVEDAPPVADRTEPAPPPAPRRRRTPAAASAMSASEADSSETVKAPSAPKARKPRATTKASSKNAADTAETTAPQPIDIDEVKAAKPRAGWWKRS